MTSGLSGYPGLARRRCDLSQPTISHQLKVLHEAGLVDREKPGVWVYYRARTDALASLGGLIGCPPA